ncbi:hypothetical protein BDD43_2348 [Mucilaginibacter gracilis]|uniref:Uncharacterized protein n=1 Tax=Mucilaginibacter gracilis TaxID=423350 RepID=A0A495IZQ5_9SPHI|nr:hypothetical protein BDD43_2348 [Mucilaginibacter gracilis]
MIIPTVKLNKVFTIAIIAAMIVVTIIAAIKVYR